MSLNQQYYHVEDCIFLTYLNGDITRLIYIILFNDVIMFGLKGMLRLAFDFFLYVTTHDKHV